MIHPPKQTKQPQSAAYNVILDTTEATGVLVGDNKILFKVGESNATIKAREMVQQDAQRKNSSTVNNRTTSVDSPNQEVEVIGYSSSQCVPYARERSGISAVQGTAKDIRITDKTPSPGAVLITTESTANHAAFVVAVSDTAITVEEANFIKGKITKRVIPRDAGFIKGFVGR